MIGDLAVAEEVCSQPRTLARSKLHRRDHLRQRARYGDEELWIRLQVDIGYLVSLHSTGIATGTLVPMLHFVVS